MLKSKLKLFLPVLVLFDGGEGGGGEGAAESGGPQAEVPVYHPRNQRSGGELANVVYGKQESDSDAGNREVVSSDAQAERASRWNEARQEFKAEFDGEVQRIINKRFGETKGLQEQLEAVSPVIDLLRDRYGVTDGDMDALMSAMEEDDSYWQDAADEQGMTVEQYKQFKRYERENAELNQQIRAIRQQEQADNQLRQWWQQGEELKRSYPSFDLQREAQNPEFLRLLQSGVPVDHAFQVIHMEEIMQGVAANTAKAAERQITANIRARGARPAEAGASGKAGFTVKNDVSKLTRKDRAEIAKRAMRGETIEF